MVANAFRYDKGKYLKVKQVVIGNGFCFGWGCGFSLGCSFGSGFCISISSTEL